MAGGIYVARKSAALVFAGKTVFVEQGVTLAREGHPILEAAGEMFEPAFVHFEVIDDPEQPSTPEPSEPPAPVKPEDDTPPPADPPAAKDVRAWAKEKGIEVPARGALPEAVVAQYVAAHQED